MEMNEKVHLLTEAEAIQLIKRSERTKGCLIYVHVAIDARIVDDPEHVFRDAVHGAVQLSKAEAVKMLTGSLPKGLEERGARIRIVERHSQFHSSMWIGS